MPEKHTAENLLNSLVETFAEKQKSAPFFEEKKSNTKVSSKFKRLFGRQKSVHHLLGGGKSADVLLWRNKKISASVLTSSTSVWALFEWFDYRFLSLLCFSLALVMIAQFLGTKAAGIFDRDPSNVPRLVIPEDFFVSIAIKLGAEVNRGLQFLQDVACGRNLKQFLTIVTCLLSAAVMGSWWDFLTVIYIGFVAAHTLPVLYEKHEDQVDDFIYKLLDQILNHYRKLDAGLLSKIPKGQRRGKKHD